MPAWPARLSVLVGLLAVATLPGAVALAEVSEEVELLDAVWAVPVAGLLGILAISLAARARRRAEWTLRRVSGAGLARAGRALGFLGVYLALSAALALGFFGLLSLFAS